MHEGILSVVVRRTAFATALAVSLAMSGCGKSDAAATPDAAAANPAGLNNLVKLSKFGRSEYCSVAAGPDGTLHAVFTDAPDAYKPTYLYYRASRDGGATWGEPVNLSDDESGNAASMCRVLIDGGGRVYAIWKYVNKNELLDGPGGNAAGVLAMRCLNGGNWTPAVKIGDVNDPSYSWFATVAPDGKVNLIWSHPQPDADVGHRGMSYYANNLEQAVLDGGAQPAPRSIIAAPKLPTEAEQKAAAAAGHPIGYDDFNAKQDGLWNLRGYVDGQGRPHFVAEHAPVTQPRLNNVIMLYDGAKLSQLHVYTTSVRGNSFNNPPMLVRGADGRDHLLRKPEESERNILRDYPIENGKQGDPVEALGDAADKADIFNWSFWPLEGSKVAALASLSTDGGAIKPTDLYLAIGDGSGHWTKPVNVTDNDARQKSASGNGVNSWTTYAPSFAAAAPLAGGNVGIVMITDEHTSTAINTVDTNGAHGIEGFSSHTPYVFFTKVKG